MKIYFNNGKVSTKEIPGSVEVRHINYDRFWDVYGSALPGMNYLAADASGDIFAYAKQPIIKTASRRWASVGERLLIDPIIRELLACLPAWANSLLPRTDKVLIPGQYWKHDNGSIFIAARVSREDVKLIDLSDGNRVSDDPEFPFGTENGFGGPSEFTRIEAVKVNVTGEGEAWR